MFDRFRRAQEFAEQHAQAPADAGSHPTISLARQAVAVSIDPSSGKPWNGARLVGPSALLIELLAAGRLRVDGEGTKARVQVVDASPLADVDLDEALVTIGEGFESDKVVSLLGVVPQTSTLLERMVADEQLTQEEHKRLGLFPVSRYHPTPLSGRDDAARKLRTAMTSDSRPDQRTLRLVGSLVGVHPKVYVDRGEVNEAYRRMPGVREQLGADEWAIMSAAKEAQAKANYSQF